MCHIKSNPWPIKVNTKSPTNFSFTQEFHLTLEKRFLPLTFAKASILTPRLPDGESFFPAEAEYPIKVLFLVTISNKMDILAIYYQNDQLVSEASGNPDTPTQWTSRRHMHNSFLSRPSNEKNTKN